MSKNYLSIKLISLISVFFLMLSLVSCYDDKNSVCKNDIIETSETEREPKIFFEKEIATYILNVKSKKIHKVTCGTGNLMLPENRKTYEGDIVDLFDQGYTKCGNCFK